MAVRPLSLPACFALLWVLASTPAAARGAVDAGQILVQAGAAAGLLGEEQGSGSRWGLVRWSWGDRFQLRAEIPWWQVDEGASLPSTGSGPVSGGTAGRRGQGPGNGSGNHGSSAGTQGSSYATSLPSVVAAPASAEEGSSRSGLGDLRLGASLRLSGGGSQRHRLDLSTSVKLPTSDRNDALGSDETDYRVGLAGEYRFWTVTLFAGAGYNRLGDPPGVELRDVPDALVGIESQPLRERVMLSGWVEGNAEIFAGEGARYAAAAGLRTLGRVRFELVATVGLSDAAERYSVALGVATGLRSPFAGPSGARR